MKCKIAIIGSRDAIAGFSLLGIDIVPVESKKEAVEQLLNLKRETRSDENGREINTYAIVFITEDFAEGISPDDEKKLSRGALPAIIPLPSHQGSTGYSMQRLKRIVERAVGSDILQ